MVTYLRNSILATLVYYDIFEHPLTLLEVYKYLVNPARIKRITDGIGDIRLDNISDELDRLVRSKIIGEKNGFYFLAGKDMLYDLRIRNQKIADQKWKKFLKLTKFLAATPYLRGVFASGSMALGNADEESDFDVLIIAKPGRLYTCRLFLWLITSVLGVRRKKHEKIAPNRFCFNHYVTLDNLYLSHESIFNAQTYINLKPVMIEPELVDSFYSSNLWLNNYIYNFKVQKDFTRRSVKSAWFIRALGWSMEKMLDTYIGVGFEVICRSLQQNMIKNNPVTYEPDGRIIFTDNELEFHPHSFEKFVIEKYNRGLEKSGIIPYLKELDSGLT